MKDKVNNQTNWKICDFESGENFDNIHFFESRAVSTSGVAESRNVIDTSDRSGSFFKFVEIYDFEAFAF